MFALLDANCDGRIDLFGSTHASPSEPERYYLIEQLGRPGAVTGARASRGTFRDRVRVTWRRVPQADRYEVWRKSGSRRVKVGTTRSTPLDDRRARRGMRYRYAVRALNRVGGGPLGPAGMGFRRR